MQSISKRANMPDIISPLMPLLINIMSLLSSLNLSFKIEESFINIINKSNENNIEIIAFTPIPFIKEAFTFFEANNLDELEDTLKKYVNFINEYTKINGIKSIDIYNMFINNILKNHNYYDIYFDGVHLNENGHSVFALELYKALSEIIIKY